MGLHVPYCNVGQRAGAPLRVLAGLLSHCAMASLDKSNVTPILSEWDITVASPTIILTNVKVMYCNCQLLYFNSATQNRTGTVEPGSVMRYARVVALPHFCDSLNID